MVPLPVQAELLSREVIGQDYSCSIILVGGEVPIGTHSRRHFTVLVAQHGPAVNPADGRDGEHTAHTATVLEHDAVPVALLGVDDSTLSQIREATELTLQDDVLLPRAVQVLCAVAHLTAMLAGAVRLADELGIVSSVVLHDAGSLQQAALIGLTLEVVAQRTFDDTLQVACQLAHLARSEEHVGRAVVVEEQRSVVEVAQTRVDGPRAFSLLGGEDVCVAHLAGLVGSQQRPELTVVILQRRSPLAAAIDGTDALALLLLEGQRERQVVLRRVRQLIEDIAHGLPVLQILRRHHRGAGHQVHGRTDKIECIADADNVGIGHVGPQHWILDSCLSAASHQEHSC